MSESDLLIELRAFNKNVEWLKKNRQSVPIENNAAEWIYQAEAQKILNRSRSWIETRRINAAMQPMNTNWFLIRGIDWQYEGKMLIYRRASILRLKSEMIRMGASKESTYE